MKAVYNCAAMSNKKFKSKVDFHIIEVFVDLVIQVDYIIYVQY